MTGISAIGSGLQGIQTAQNQLDQAAHQLSRPGNGAGKVKDLVSMKEAKLAVAANAAVIRAASEIEGTLVDILA